MQYEGTIKNLMHVCQIQVAIVYCQIAKILLLHIYFNICIPIIPIAYVMAVAAFVQSKRLLHLHA